MKRTAKIVCTVIIAVTAITGVALASMGLFGEFAGIEKEKLEGYKYSRSGGIQGGSYSESVQEYSEDHALFTIMQHKWHSDDGTVKEYLVDKEILNELKAVFVKYHMENGTIRNLRTDLLPMAQAIATVSNLKRITCPFHPSIIRKSILPS